MFFGNSDKFAIEIYHEPLEPRWVGFGRMCIHIESHTIGDINEAHCSLYHAIDRILDASNSLTNLWDERFSGHSGEEIFALIDAALYTGEPSEMYEEFEKFDFLTNTGEQFDRWKTFIYCTPDKIVNIPFQDRDLVVQTPSCSVNEFQSVSGELARWFIERIK
jgi:hypothetical protein